MTHARPECIPAMINAGLSEDDAYALRRAAMQLHRWYELECGTDSGAVERDEMTNRFWLAYSFCLIGEIVVVLLVIFTLRMLGVP